MSDDRSAYTDVTGRGPVPRPGTPIRNIAADPVQAETRGERVHPDIAANALISAFSGHGCTAYLGDPNTLVVRFPDGGKGSVDIAEWRMFAGRTPPPALPGAAAQWVQAVVYKQRTKRPAAPVQQRSEVGRMIAEGSLRVRLYPEDALSHPPGLREALVVRPLAPGLIQVLAEDQRDSTTLVNRVDLGGIPEEQAFGAGLRAAIEKDGHYSERKEIRGVPITVVGGEHRYIGAHVQVLGRHARPGRFGALVTFPLPEYICVHEIGETVIFEAMETLQDLSRTFVEKGEKPISSQLFWWRPGRYEQQPETQALSSGQVPDLRPVGVDMERAGNEVKVRAHNDATLELIDLWARDQQRGQGR
jgi:hypothetical protein